MKLRSGTESRSPEKEGVNHKKGAKYTTLSSFDWMLSRGTSSMFWLLKVTSVFLVLMYVVVPIFVKTNPWIQTKIIFLNNLRWPPFVDFTQPEHLGLARTKNFYIQSNSDVRLGLWHMLPATLNVSNTTDDFEDLLKDTKPIILYLHGNSGTRAGWHRVGLYKLLARMDFHVIAVDYRGYGDSSGSPSEDGVVADSLVVYNWLRERKGQSPLFLWGHSLGTGVTTKLARQLCKSGVEPEGIFLESGFNNIIDAAIYHPIATPFKIIPWFHWLFIDTITENDIHFQSDKSIADVTPPLLMMHAEDDMVVPYHLGKKLYEAALTTRPDTYGPVEFVSFNASFQYGHKLIFMAPELPDIISKFVQKCISLKNEKK